MAETDWSWVFLRLKHALQALAMPAEKQIAHYPDFVSVTAELANDFDNFREAVTTSPEITLTVRQRETLAAVDAHLGAMSGAGSRELWTPHALKEPFEWQEVRQLAETALAAFDWPVESPPSYAHEFVQLAQDTNQDGDDNAT